MYVHKCLTLNVAGYSNIQAEGNALGLTYDVISMLNILTE